MASPRAATRAIVCTLAILTVLSVLEMEFFCDITTVDVGSAVLNTVAKIAVSVMEDPIHISFMNRNFFKQWKGRRPHCSVPCYVHNNFSDAHMLFFHYPTLEPPYLDGHGSKKHMYQRTVLFGGESDENYPLLNDVEVTEVYDLQMNYRLDSDVPYMYFPAHWPPENETWTPHQWVKNYTRRLMLPPLPFSHKKNGTVWLARNCATVTGREQIAHELMRSGRVGFESHGRCLNNMVQLPSFTDDNSSNESSESLTTPDAEFEEEDLHENDSGRLLAEVAAGGIVTTSETLQDAEIPTFGDGLWNLDIEDHADDLDTLLDAIAGFPEVDVARVPDKISLYRQYKFCYCMENSMTKDYFTEKIWDCLEAGCLPIINGPPNAKRLLPSPSAALDINDPKIGGDWHKLEEEILRLANDEEAYESYMAWRKLPVSELSEGFRKLQSISSDGHMACRACLHYRNKILPNLPRDQQIEAREVKAPSCSEEDAKAVPISV